MDPTGNLDGQQTSFLELIETRSSQPVRRCYQCDKCANGCPMLEHMDFSTNQLFQLIQFDAEDAALSANTPWLCASCYTCSVRCPNEIDIAQVMDVVRAVAVERNYPPALPDFVRFHELFLDAIKRRGRINEISLMARLHRDPRDLLAQRKLGWAMFRAGRLKWPTPGVHDRKALQRLFGDERERKIGGPDAV